MSYLNFKDALAENGDPVLANHRGVGCTKVIRVE
jgi:hypothetical protein